MAKKRSVQALHSRSDEHLIKIAPLLASRVHSELSTTDNASIGRTATLEDAVGYTKGF